MAKQAIDVSTLSAEQRQLLFSDMKADLEARAEKLWEELTATEAELAVYGGAVRYTNRPKAAGKAADGGFKPPAERRPRGEGQRLILSHLEKGPAKPKAISEATGISVPSVNNAIQGYKSDDKQWVKKAPKGAGWMLTAAGKAKLKEL